MTYSKSAEFRLKSLRGKRRTAVNADGAVSKPVRVLLYLYYMIFAASNVYDWGLSQQLTLYKWAPLLIIALLLLLMTLSKVRANLYAGVVLVPIYIVSFLAFSTYLNIGNFASFIVLVSLVLTFWVALYLGATVERMTTTVQVVKHVGILIIGTSFVLYCMDINLGRAQPRFSGWIDNPNTLGQLIVPSLVIVLWELINQQKKVLLLISVLLAGVWILIETESRASLGWFAVSASLLFIIRIKSQAAVFFCSLMVLLSASASDYFLERTVDVVARGETSPEISLLSGRDEVWTFAAEIIREKPLFGHGSGSSEPLVRVHYSRFLNHTGEQVHSSYLTAALEGGLLVALILVVSLIVACGRAYTQSRNVVRYHTSQQQRNIARLSFALLVGAAFHGLFETWFLSAGNTNTLWFWALTLGVLSQRKVTGSRRYLM